MEDFRRRNGVRHHVLIVDDEIVNRLMLGNILSLADGKEYVLHYAENGREAVDLLEKEGQTISLILLDLMMPVMDGFEFLTWQKSKEEVRQIPVIVMTSEKSAEVKSIRKGAVDFIPKPFDSPEVILARCERIIELSEDKTIIRSAERDVLTGLYTKDFFYEYIRQMERSDSKRDMDVMVLNIDHFHLINELYGRREGDRVLGRVGSAVAGFLSKASGLGCRMEADSFCVYCDHVEDYGPLLEGILSELSDLSHSPKVRLRIGIYQHVDKEAVIETWFDRAKMAADQTRMDYTAVAGYYSRAMYEKTIFHERLINDIDEAMAQGDLVVYFQPKYNIQGDRPRLTSAEALIRWKHPELGMISPGDFIPLFESNGLIQKVDHYVWRQAGAQVRKWKEKLGLSVPVSVNVSRVDIFDPELVNKLSAILEENHLEAREFMLEITETAYSDNVDRLVDAVDTLRERHFTLEMDDFGSGYSSLNMLTTIHVDVLKMDMKFVRNMMKDTKCYRMVELVMDIANFLGIPVVAEGVEDEAQLQALKALGCEIIQGYYFSKPVTPEEFEVFIKKELSLQGGIS